MTGPVARHLVMRTWMLVATALFAAPSLLAQTTIPAPQNSPPAAVSAPIPETAQAPQTPQTPTAAPNDQANAPTPQTDSGSTPPETRQEDIAFERRQKHARLWPEHEGGLVARANRLLDRGFVEGVRTGEGNNGWQLVLTGTRPAQGQTWGIGYRRSDLRHDTLTVRGTARMTLRGAFLADGELNVNQLRRSEGTFIDVYAKYERSPRMEFYGLGANSSQADRTGYLLNTGTVEGEAGYRFTRQLNGGFTLGYGHAHTGSVTREDIPSIETRFDATTAPGLFDDARFVYLGGFAGFDTRDLPRGPRHGGFYGVRMLRFADVDGGLYTHSQLELNGQQFLPYFNATKVLALFVKARFAFADGDDIVPFYMQPTLGGNFELRGFAPYRFYDHNAFVAAVEHRWYVFSGLEMAAFMDTGTTVPTKGHIAFDDLNFSGGLGFRVRFGDAIVMRTDFAKGREGWRFIMSLSDVSRRRF